MTNDRDKAFEDLDWHDAVLLSVLVDRRSPGENDEVVLMIQWPDGQRQAIRFTNCYALDVGMNFGVVAPESISAGIEVCDSVKLEEIRRRWSALGVDLRDLRCFEVATASTASTISVFARGFEIADC